MGEKHDLKNFNNYQKDLNECLVYEISLMQNINMFFDQRNISIKNKLMSSIFKEKIEFDGKKYRTPKFKEGFESIHYGINISRSVVNKKGDNLSNVSLVVLEVGIEPTLQRNTSLSRARLPIPPLEPFLNCGWQS